MCACVCVRLLTRVRIARMDHYNENTETAILHVRREHKRAAKRVEITVERNSHGLSHTEPIVLPLIVAMGTSNTATKRDQHEMEINLN